MEDISKPSHFTQWDQSINGTTWVSDGNPNNLDPVMLTPEMLEQTDKLNILCTDQDSMFMGQIDPCDQLVTLEVLAIGKNHGVAKCAYGGVFLTQGVLKYLDVLRISEGEAGTWIGDKFTSWITFTNARYPWRTVTNGVVH